MSRLGLFAGLVLGLALVAGWQCSSVSAQDLGLGESTSPIEISAQDGIEWLRRESVITARGDAMAVRGDIAVKADTLRAHYRETPQGRTEIWRLDAEGRVEISSPKHRAYAEKAAYDVDNAVLVLISGGERVTLVGPEAEISAEQQIEYWEKSEMLIARGNARASASDRGVSADVLVAYFGQNPSGETVIERVDAFDDVGVVTREERLQAQRGIYRANAGVVSLMGQVRISRGPNQINGCRAEVDLTTGVSRLLACPGQDSSNERVGGLIRPEEKSHE